MRWQTLRTAPRAIVIEATQEFRIRYASAIARLKSRGNAERWNLDRDDAAIVDAIHRSVAAAELADDAIESYLDTLHAEDLVLACACRAGLDPAWEHFIARYRPALYSAARAIAGDEERGRELADTLYADLYGLEVRHGRRRSLLDYFHGRSSFATWLRAVMAQRYVDYVRGARKFEPLDNRPEPMSPPIDDSLDRARYVGIVGAALDAALLELPPRDRMLLGYYYHQQLTLLQIARLLGEHESTVSRRLTRIRGDIRIKVERALRHEHRLSNEQIALCYGYASEDLPLDLARALPEAK